MNSFAQSVMSHTMTQIEDNLPGIAQSVMSHTVTQIKDNLPGIAHSVMSHTVTQIPVYHKLINNDESSHI